MIELAYASFARRPPPDLSGGKRIGVWLACAAFVLWGLGCAAVLNAVGLLAGTTIRFIGRDGVRYRFFRLFGRVRAIVIAAPVFFCFFAWREAQAIGLFQALWPTAAVLGLAGACVGMCAGLGKRTSTTP